jgi:phosphatidylglycerol---prolipoprotein diacylglyceryl transferase
MPPPSFVASIGWPVIGQRGAGSGPAALQSLISIGFIAIGSMAGLWLFGRIGPKRGIPPAEVSAIGSWSLAGGIIGARLFYVVGHYADFGSFVSTLQIYNGGLSLLGGIAGATLVNLPRIRRRGYRFFQVADAVVPALAFGIGVGRIGDLIVGDHLGKPTSWWLAWTYRGGNLAPPWACSNGICQVGIDGGRELEVVSRTGAKLLDAQGRVIAQGVGVHPTAFYDLILVCGLFVLLWTLNNKPRREGILTLTFGLWYGLERILVDAMRIDKRFGPFTGSQWTSIVVVVVSASLLVWWASHPGSAAGGSNVPRARTTSRPEREAPPVGSPWNLSPDEIRIYKGGQRHALAATIVRLRPGWRMVAVNRHVAAQAPDGRCFDVYGWARWDHVREVDLQELEQLGFGTPVFDERVEDVARRLLAGLDPLSLDGGRGGS